MCEIGAVAVCDGLGVAGDDPQSGLVSFGVFGEQAHDIDQLSSAVFGIGDRGGAVELSRRAQQHEVLWLLVGELGG
ncbi:Uncharacterised protein [Mycobacteroides abscessus subsp. abscessus]|nr:Uncharacterised protein [Mycobacteroides abscessus subsp. abscessus]